MYIQKGLFGRKENNDQQIPIIENNIEIYVYLYTNTKNWHKYKSELVLISKLNVFFNP